MLVALFSVANSAVAPPPAAITSPGGATCRAETTRRKGGAGVQFALHVAAELPASVDAVRPSFDYATVNGDRSRSVNSLGRRSNTAVADAAD